MSVKGFFRGLVGGIGKAIEGTMIRCIGVGTEIGRSTIPFVGPGLGVFIGGVVGIVSSVFTAIGGAVYGGYKGLMEGDGAAKKAMDTIFNNLSGQEDTASIKPTRGNSQSSSETLGTTSTAEVIKSYKQAQPSAPSWDSISEPKEGIPDQTAPSAPPLEEQKQSKKEENLWLVGQQATPGQQSLVDPMRDFGTQRTLPQSAQVAEDDENKPKLKR